MSAAIVHVADRGAGLALSREKWERSSAAPAVKTGRRYSADVTVNASLST